MISSSCVSDAEGDMLKGGDWWMIDWSRIGNGRAGIPTIRAKSSGLLGRMSETRKVDRGRERANRAFQR